MYAVAEFNSTAGNDLINKTWGNLPAPFDWDPSSGENVQYGNGFNNAPAGGPAGTIVINTPYVMSSKIQFPTSPGDTTNFNFYLNGANNGGGYPSEVFSATPQAFGTAGNQCGSADAAICKPRIRK